MHAALAILFLQATDASGSPGLVGHPAAPVLEPLRLYLLGEYVTRPTFSPECSDGAAGSSGFAIHRSEDVRLAPRLTLFGFSRTGCLLDGALGGGASYVVPLRPNILFAVSAGAIYLPHAGPNGTAAMSTAARVDMVLPRRDGRSMSVGVGVTRGVPSLNLGSIF